MGLAWLVLPLTMGGLGGMGLTALFSGRRLSRSEMPIAFLIWSPIFVSIASLAMAEAGCLKQPAFSVASLCWGIFGMAALWVVRRRSAVIPAEPVPKKSPLFPWVVAAVLAIGFGLSYPAHRYLLGGWDPGNYVCAAAHMAQTGDLQAHDSLLPELKRAERRALMYDTDPKRPLLQAGFLITDPKRGLLIPNFYHLYPAWLAVWIAGLGLDGAWIGQSVMALLALLMAMLTAARLFGRPAAALAGLALLACPAQAYLMRFTTSEMLTQFCLLSSFWALDKSFEKRNNGFLLTAAAAFGASILAHGTSLLPLAGALLFLTVRACGTPGRGGWAAPIALAAAGGLAMVWNGMRADVMTRFLVDVILSHPTRWAPAALAAAVGAAGCWFARRAGRTSDKWERVTRLLPVSAAGLLLLVGGWVRPAAAPGPEADNVRYFAALVGIPGLALALVFLAQKGWRDWTDGQRAFLAAGALTAVVLLANKMVAPLYFFAARRWVPIVVPFIMFMAAAAGTDLLKRRLIVRALAAALAAVWLFGMARLALPVWRVHEYAGMPEVLSRLARLTADADRVLCNHWDPATPLRYAFGIPAWSLSRLAQPKGVKDARQATAMMRRWLAEGKRVYWIGDRFYDPAFSLIEKGAAGAPFAALERRADRLPRSSVTESKTFTVWQVGPSVKPPLEEPVFLDVGYSAMGLSGFWKFERERDPVTKTWIGYRRTLGRGRLRMPAFAGPWRIRLNGGQAAAEGRRAVTLRADGALLAELTVGPGWETYSFDLPPGQANSNVVTLEIRSTTARQGNKDFGVAVDWLARGTEKKEGGSAFAHPPVPNPSRD